jgi:hypothetical protein
MAPPESLPPVDAPKLGQVHNLDDESERWTTAFHGYMSVQGQPVNTPNADIAPTFQPSPGSVDITVSAFIADDDMSMVRFNLLAPNCGLTDDRCGQLDIWAMDIQACSIEQVSGDELAGIVHHFQPAANMSA